VRSTPIPNIIGRWSPTPARRQKLWSQLTPTTLGSLLALYEHKTTMLATLLGINAFDQPGVELGKLLARQHEGQ
jgi:glucose-6-phosphate isomerase